MSSVLEKAVVGGTIGFIVLVSFFEVLENLLDFVFIVIFLLMMFVLLLKVS